MPLDPARTVARARGAPRADRRRERRPAGRLDGDVGAGARVAARQGRRRPARGGDRRGRQPVVHAARRAPSGRSLIGGHIDSVPNGGWLDGCLNVVAGVEVLRRIAAEGTPPVTVRLVNWADEEGARFGRSLFGSSAAAGSMRDQDELRAADRPRRDRAARRAARARRRPRPRARRALAARRRGRLPRAAHRAGPGARVDGPAARRRARHVRRRALADHVARPGGARRLDADGQAPRRARRRGEARARDPRRSPREVGGGAVCTSGGVVCKPGIVTSVVETAEQLLDQRHLDAATLARMLDAREGGVPSGSPPRRTSRSSGSGSGAIEPILFDETLIGLADEAIREVAGTSHRLPSGPLHDAAEVSRAGVPTVMIFVQSLRGLSHTKLEDTKREHLELSVEALDRLASKTIVFPRLVRTDACNRLLLTRLPRSWHQGPVGVARTATCNSLLLVRLGSQHGAELYRVRRPLTVGSDEPSTDAPLLARSSNLLCSRSRVA